jgi:hypothetical protein
VFLYRSWQLIWWLLFVRVVPIPPLGVPLPSFYIQGGQGYKEGNRVGSNMIPIRTLSPLAYFTYIFIAINIYALGSMTSTFGIFWMVSQVIADPFLGLPSLWGLVPRVPILVSSPWVLGKWVDTGWSGSSLSVTNWLSTQFKNQVLWHKITKCFFTELIEKGHCIGAPIRYSPRLSN